MLQSLGGQPPQGQQQPPQQQQQSFGNFQQQQGNLNQQQSPQQQQHLNNGNGNGNGNGPGAASSAANGGGSQDAASSSQPEYTLAGILHYLQSEWRRYEKDRNEWEIERAEMRARIALLEGERRGVENLKTDLMRRVKMLEYALRQERSKYLTGSSSSTAGPLKNPALSSLEKEATLSGRSSPSLQDSDSNIASIHPRNASTFSLATLASTAAAGAGSTFSISSKSSAAKDHIKSRDKSRDYLKQCLQEISYLTSQDVLNPLPERAYATSAAAAAAASIDAQRPRKAMTDDFPPKGNSNAFSTTRPSGLSNETPLSEADETVAHPASAIIGHPAGKQAPRPPSPQPYSTDAESSSSAAAAAATSGEDGLPVFRSTGGADDWKALKEAGEVQRAKRERERRKLQDEQEQSSDDASDPTDRLQRLMRQGTVRGSALGGIHSGAQADGSADDDAQDADATGANERLWKLKKTLRVHTGAVKSVAFDTVGAILFSASQDHSIRASLVDGEARSEAQSPTRGTSPAITLTGHTAAVTSLAVASSRGRLFSGSVDSTIRVWNYGDKLASWRQQQQSGGSSEGDSPAATLEALATISTPSQIVNLTLLPSWAGDDALLATASADGYVRVYDISGGSEDVSKSASEDLLSLLYEFDYFGSSPSDEAETEREQLRQDLGGLPIPTSVSVVYSNIKQVAVSWSNSIVKLYSIESGAEHTTLKLDRTFDQTPATQINTIVSHPTLPLLFSGHEDKFIRVADLTNGQVILSMHGHRDAVVSLDIDPAGLKLLSGGHDGTVRVWDMNALTKRFTGGSSGSSRQSGSSETSDGEGAAAGGDDDDEDDDDDDSAELECVQELTDHATANGEGVLAVRYHKTMPFFGTGGADGLVRIYG